MEWVTLEKQSQGRTGSHGNWAWQPLSPHALSPEVAWHPAELRPGGPGVRPQEGLGYLASAGCYVTQIGR